MRTTYKATLAVSALAALAGTASAQLGSGASVTDDNITWTQRDWQTTATAAASTYMPVTQPNALRVNDLPVGVSTFSNFVHQNEWFYRFSTVGKAETRERNLNNISSATTISGNEITYSFSIVNTNATGAETINATLKQVVDGINDGQGKVVQTLTLSNPGATDVNMAIFNWAKFHAVFTQSSSNAVEVTTSGLGQRTIKSTNNTSFDVPVSVLFSADGLSTLNTNWQADTASTSSGILPSLTNATLTGLNGQLNSLGAGVTTGNVSNLSAAYRYDVLIPAGGSVSVSSTLQVIPAPGAMALLGMGGLIAARRRRA